MDRSKKCNIKNVPNMSRNILKIKLKNIDNKIKAAKNQIKELQKEKIVIIKAARSCT